MKPQFACQECGKKFGSVKAAYAATFGPNGCPGCGGTDIDEYVPGYDEKKTAHIAAQAHLRTSRYAQRSLVA